MKTMKEIIQSYGTSMVSLCFIIGVPLCYMLIPDQVNSIEENRTLQQMPKLHIADILQKQYQDDMSSYLNDQFPKRFALHKQKVSLEHALGNNEFSSVLIGKNDMLFQDIPAIEDTKIKQLSDTINSFVKQYHKINIHMLIAVNKAEIYPENLPAHITLPSQKKTLSSFYKTLNKKIKITDIEDHFLDQKKENLYYRSDHHWTTKGAYEALQVYIKNDLKAKNTLHYEPYVIHQTFQGALANTSGYYSKKDDQVEIYVPDKNDPDVLVEYVNEKEKAASVYVESKASSSNPYEVFFGGNHALIQMTTSSDTDKRLLVIKDSYANAFLPFLTPYYHEITVIDPRYYMDYVNELMKNRNITDVLFLYNFNTFFTDSSLVNLLQ